MLATHYHHLEDGSDIRQVQSDALISGWSERPLTVLLGDMNGVPNTPEIVMLAEAGMVDISAEIGTQPTYTYYSTDPDHQIDYIWLSPDWLASNFNIYQTTASDHLPLAVTLTIP